MSQHPAASTRWPWPLAPLGLVALALGLLAVPRELEGPVLVPISPGHALAVLDAIALVPLLGGTGWLYRGLWTRRGRLSRRLCIAPGSSSLGILVAGIGLGLLLGSVVSQFFWWWAVGAVLVGGVLLGAVALAARGG